MYFIKKQKWHLFHKDFLEDEERIFSLQPGFICGNCFAFVSRNEMWFVCNWLLLQDHSTVFLPQKIQFQRKWSATSVEKRMQMRNAGTLTAAHTATACRVRLSAPPSAAHLCLVLNPSMWREAAVPCVQVVWCNNPVYCHAAFLGLIIRFFNWVF